jgi:hypothetical protein
MASLCNSAGNVDFDPQTRFGKLFSAKFLMATLTCRRRVAAPWTPKGNLPLHFNTGGEKQFAFFAPFFSTVHGEGYG